MLKQAVLLGFAVMVSSGMASAIQINEFEPNPFGSDSANQLIELRGAPGASFTGNLFSIEADVAAGTVDHASPVSGIFDANGLLTVSIPDLENPSFTLVLSSDDATATVGSPVTDLSVLGTVLDAIGIPDTVGDEAFLLGAALGGTDFAYTGDEPKLVFRDSLAPSTLWAINDPAFGNAISPNGTTATLGDFNINPETPTFGAVNPTASTAVPVQINEFEPNPFGSDSANQLIELRGAPGASFTGNLFSIEADVAAGTVDHASPVSGIFDANGLLTISIPDLENPSFTLVLSSDDATATVGSPVTDLSVLGTVLDAIGIPDSIADEAFLLGATLGGTDFAYTGDEPKLVFRDSLAPSTLWAINDPALGDAISPNGTSAALGDFNINPEVTTFGAANPTRIPEPATAALLAFGALAMLRRRPV